MSAPGWGWDAGQPAPFDAAHVTNDATADAHIPDASIEDANVTDVADAAITCDPALYEASSARHIAGRCAYFFKTVVPWNDAEAACRAKGLQLITVGSGQETDALVAWISSQENGTWTGLNDRAAEGAFVWHVGDGGAPPATPYMPAVTGNDVDSDCVELDVLPPSAYRAHTCNLHVRAYTCTPP